MTVGRVLVLALFTLMAWAGLIGPSSPAHAADHPVPGTYQLFDQGQPAQTIVLNPGGGVGPWDTANWSINNGVVTITSYAQVLPQATCLQYGQDWPCMASATLTGSETPGGIASSSAPGLYTENVGSAVESSSSFYAIWTGYVALPPAENGNLPTPVTGMASLPDGSGYWLTDTAGGVSAHGNAANYGSMAGHVLNAPVTHIVATADGRGYWLVAADGGILTFGDAGFFGSMGNMRLNASVVDIAPTTDGQGYWLVASDGGVFAFGDAVFYGSMGGQHVNQPVVGIAADYATGGYWLVASDGGVFSFNAPFLGSTGNIALNKPVNGVASTPDGQGYWFAASDGGVFAFGDAQFHGSIGNLVLNAPIMGMAANNATGGYWLVGADGGTFSFGTPFYGAD